jgi:hypothetical protein
MLAGWVALTALFAGCSAQTSAHIIPTVTIPAPSPTPTVVQYTPYRPLLAEVSRVGPVYVTGDAHVPHAALDEAGALLAAMLRHRPDVAAILRDRGTITAVFARDETVCDLPYFAEFQGTGVCARYEGGAGGTAQVPVTACSERNLLKEPDDPYGRGTQPYGANICVHELAHTVMDVGLSDADRDRIAARYEEAKRAGLWTGDYAMTNSLEFFAEMSQSYFSAAPGVPTYLHTHGINGADALKRYDPASFALLDAIYQGAGDLK